MTTTPHHRSTPALALASLLLAAGLSACSSTPPRAPAPPASLVTIDGDTTEWPSGANMAADGSNLYFGFSVPGTPFTLQAADESVVLALDTDASTSTGVTSDLKAFDQLGVDMEIVFSPRKPDGRAGNGVALARVDSAGNRTAINHGEADFSFAPTFANPSYEGRFSRFIAQAPELARAGLVRGIFSIRDSQGQIVGYSDPFEVRLPAAKPAPLADAVIPQKPLSAVRLVSWNILRGKPVDEPAVFARMLQALRPDVVLLQEWNRGTEAELKSWFTVHVDPTVDWNVRLLEQPADKPGLTGGVAIVSRLPLSPAAPTPKVESDTVRAIAAKVRSPLGEIAVASIHLKCCGSAAGPEEARRIAEASAVNATLKALRAPMIAVGGDYNLVGGRAPLDTLANSLDAGGNLAPAPAFLLGERLMTTWRDDPSPFSAGRLDYVLTSPSTLSVAQTFIVDTRRLTDGALAMMGLDRADSAASDHMPVVVDLTTPPAKK